jgi:hypothetical protein
VLAVAGPLTVVHLLGGVHNDALMVGFLACGLAVAASPPGRAVSSSAPCSAGSARRSTPPFGRGRLSAGPAAASALTAKGARFVIPDRLVERAIRTVATVGVALATMAVLGLVARAGWGWVGGIGANARSITVLSVSTTIGFLLAPNRSAAGHRVDHRACHAATLTAVGVAIAAAILFFTPTLGLAGLATALAVVALLGPAVQPWYLTWCLAAAVALAGRRISVAMVAAAVVVLADGTNLALRPRASVWRPWSRSSGPGRGCEWSRRPRLEPVPCLHRSAAAGQRLARGGCRISTLC